MKKMLKLVVVALVTLAFSAVSFAAPATPATPATPASPAVEKSEKKAEKKKPKTLSATGELVSVDAKAGTLAVKVKDKQLSLTAETKAAKQALEKVKVGDRVRVSYTEKEGKMMARSVTAAPVEKAEAKKKAEEKKEEKKAKTK